MAPMKIACVCLLVLAIFTTHTSALGKSIGKGKLPSTPKDIDFGKDYNSGTTANACCVCGQPISMTLVANNQLVEPFFKIKTEIRHPQRELLRMVEMAAAQDRRFRFSADHFGSMGYIVTGLNQLMASSTDKTYWKVSSSQHGAALPMGISQYTPAQGEVVIFNFTSWA